MAVQTPPSTSALDATQSCFFSCGFRQFLQPSLLFRSYPCLIAGLGITGCLILAGCGSSTPAEPEKEATEVAAPTKGFDGDLAEDVLFQRAKQSYHNGLYTVAKDQFQSLRDNYPTGAYVDFAELKAADCMFSLRDFGQSAPAYEDYAKNHPGTLAAQYAMVRAAQSFHLASRGVGRDAAQLDRSRELYDRVLTQYKDSIYTPEAQTDRALVLQELADYEQQIAAFYKKRGNMKAYEARKQILDQKLQPLVASAHRDAAASTRSVFVQADSPVGSDAQSMRASLALPAPAPVGARAIASPQISQTQNMNGETALLADSPLETNARIRIERAECSESFAQLFLNQMLSGQELESLNAAVTHDDSTQLLRIPDAAAEASALTCGDVTLTIDAVGTVRVESETAIALFSANNPPRLIVKF